MRWRSAAESHIAAIERRRARFASRRIQDQLLMFPCLLEANEYRPGRRLGDFGGCSLSVPSDYLFGQPTSYLEQCLVDG